MTQQYRADIDGLRAVAVLPVVLYHAGAPGVPGGFVGVDVFFVISGFLITRILAREMDDGRLSIARFYERRARRILPALMAMLAVSLAAGWFLLLPGELEDLAKSGLATTLFVSNLWFLRTLDYFAPAAELLPLLHTWSLAVEEQFYIVFPLLLLLLQRRTRGTLVAVVAALSAISFVVATVGVVHAPSATFYLASSRAWELGIGALLALTPLRIHAARPGLREAVAWAGLAAILASVVLIDSSMPFPGPTAAPAVLGSAALIWAGGAGSTRPSRLLSLRPVVFVGLISYSLYLWHWPILAFLRARAGSVDLEPAVAAAAVALAFVIATLSWRFVERPFRKPAARRAHGMYPLVAAGAAIAGAATLCVGLVVAKGAGARFDPEVIAAYEAAKRAPLQRSDRFLCNDRDPSEGLCRLGAGPATPRDGPADFLLWGDSHAMYAVPAADLAAQEAGRTGLLAIKVSCPPLLGVDRVDEGEDHGCARFNEAVIEELRSRSDVPLVILAARWALNAEGAWPENRNRPNATLRAVGDPEAERHAENFAIYRAAVDRTVAALRATGRDVVLLGTVPEMKWDVPTVLALARDSEKLNLPDREAIEARQERADAALAAAAAADDATFVPLAGLMCAPVCEVSRDGHWLYRDSHHLSWFGATVLLKPIFDAQLARPLAWPTTQPDAAAAAAGNPVEVRRSLLYGAGADSLP